MSKGLYLHNTHYHFRVSEDLKENFKQACIQAGTNAAKVLREFMNAYLDEQQLLEKGYAEWFKANPPPPS